MLVVGPLTFPSPAATCLSCGYCKAHMLAEGWTVCVGRPCLAVSRDLGVRTAPRGKSSTCRRSRRRAGPKAAPLRPQPASHASLHGETPLVPGVGHDAQLDTVWHTQDYVPPTRAAGRRGAPSF